MKKQSVVITHITFWIIVIAIRLPMLIKVEDQSYYMSILLLSFMLHSIIFYLFYFVFAKILLTKQIWLFAVFYVVFLGLYSYPITLLFNYCVSILPHFGIKMPNSDANDFFKDYLSVVTSQSIYALTGTLFRYTISWFSNIRHQEELEKQNIHNELALLRSQINPHFLFNTLNNLHSFAQNDQDKTAFGIIKLAEIMRYMLYDTNSDFVLLEKEIKYIENYIELQRLRLKDPKYIEFKVEGDITCKKIAPLLLITFIENAFKHGRKNTQNPGISINLTIENKILNFKVVNYIKQNDSDENENAGLGLKNIKRRLELIYPKNYKLDIKENDENYIVQLQIYNI